MSKKIIIIGSGFGGLSLGIRLQALGFETTILERLDQAGGRAYQKQVVLDGINGVFKFDMGPTVLTVPHFIEELLSLEKGTAQFNTNFTKDSLEAINSADSNSDLHGSLISPTYFGTQNTAKYVDIVPVLPFYRIWFDDGTFFDYDGDFEKTKQQILDLTGDQSEVLGYEKFHLEAKKVFEKGFLELGFSYFENVWDMLKVLPDMLKLDTVISLFSYAKKYFKHIKTQQIFSFETLLIGGNPLSVPAIYVMIHFVEKSWGIHYAKGGTGALVQAFVKKYEELGGKILLNSPAQKIAVSQNKTGKTNEKIIDELAKIEQKILSNL